MREPLRGVASDPCSMGTPKKIHELVPLSGPYATRVGTRAGANVIEGEPASQLSPNDGRVALWAFQVICRLQSRL